jgi:hypothetical protein
MPEKKARDAAAQLIAIEASRLARMARANDFALLAYLIDMAALEAWREASEGHGHAGDAVDG